MKTKFAKIAILAVPALLLLASCTKESESQSPFGKKGAANVVSVVIGGDAAATKSTVSDTQPVQTMEPIDFSDTGIDGLKLTESVTSLDEEIFLPETKGTPIYTENFFMNYGEDLYANDYMISGGALEKFLGDEAIQFTTEDKAEYSYTYADGIRWPDDGLWYFFQAPYSITNTLNPRFIAPSTENPMGLIIIKNYVSPTDPKKQTDILFTSKHMTETEKDKNHILMYHALTAVKFKVKYTADDELTTTTVKSVTLKGLVSGGDCTIRPNYVDGVNTSSGNPSNKKNEDNALTKSAACSTWTPGSTTADFTFVPAGIVSADSSKDDGTKHEFPGSFYDGTNSYQDNLNNEDFTQTMMLIPQTSAEGKPIECVIVLAITRDGKTTEYTRTAKMNINWKAGELHTYQFTIDKVDVKVDDTMNDAKTTKSGVTTTNSGNVTAYLRAGFSIAWFYKGANDPAAIAVAPYVGDPSKNFAGLPGTDWIEGDDGYYYYKYPVKPGEHTNGALFTSFTAPAETEEAPYPKCHLEFTVLLQGVMYDQDRKDVNTAWGTVMVKGSTTTVVSKLSTTPETPSK